METSRSRPMRFGLLRDFGGLVSWNPFVAGCETFAKVGLMLEWGVLDRPDRVALTA
jgi:hypothetical protein